MYREIIFAASLLAASTAKAQVSEPTSPAVTQDGVTSLAWARERNRILAVPSSFHAELRGELTASASGEAEFGVVRGPDPSSAAFVVSLGVCGPQGAILFTRRSGTPLGVGRYRISEGASKPDEVLALALAGPPTRTSGAFRGQSGWVTVTSSSEGVVTGRFEFNAVGVLAPEQGREDRRVQVTGSFVATAANSSLRVCGGPR